MSLLEQEVPQDERTGMIAFRKVHGAGNDFILIADPQEQLDWAALTPGLCDRHLGIGADGLVVSRRLGAGTFTVACYNADGSQASMCGNALRCAALCAARDYGQPRARVEMFGVWHQVAVDGEQVSVSVTVGPVMARALTLSYHGLELEFAAVNTGTEHVVAIVPGTAGQLDVLAVGRTVRNHPGLAPRGANVSFAQVVDEQTLRLRTYERGVEAETLSCGSGAAAAVAVARHAGLAATATVTVGNQAGAPLRVGQAGVPAPGMVWVTGPAQVVFRGEAA
jgi:diaminopimelate epimerase